MLQQSRPVPRDYDAMMSRPEFLRYNEREAARLRDMLATTITPDHELFEAIFEGRDDAIEMDVNRLNEWREYVLNNGRIPRFPEC